MSSMVSQSCGFHESIIDPLIPFGPPLLLDPLQFIAVRGLDALEFMFVSCYSSL